MTIEIRNLCKSFKDVKAVQNVNLIVESGESVALLGPNGAGKTTLSRLLPRFYNPNSGSVEINGIKMKIFYASKLALLFKRLGSLSV